MDKSVESALRIIEGTGPIGAYIAAGIVGLGLVLIILIRFAGLFDSSETDRKKTDFLDKVIGQYAAIVKIEGELREDFDRIQDENDALKDRVRELLVTTELLRVQVRRAIDLLTAVRDGRLQPAQIEPQLAELLK